MRSELETLVGKNIVSIEYHFRGHTITFCTSDNLLIQLTATNGFEDPWGRSLTYFTNFSRFDVISLQLRQLKRVTITGIAIHDKGPNTRDYTLYTSLGYMSFSLINHREGGTTFFIKVSVYEAKKTT